MVARILGSREEELHVTSTRIKITPISAKVKLEVRIGPPKPTSGRDEFKAAWPKPTLQVWVAEAARPNATNA